MSDSESPKTKPPMDNAKRFSGYPILIFCLLITVPFYGNDALANDESSGELLSHWTFDNESLDRVGTHHGTLVESSFSTESKLGSHSVRFGDRSENRSVMLGDVDPSAGDLTISMWINPDPSGNGHQILMAKRNAWKKDHLRWQFLWQDILPKKDPIPGEPYALTKEVLRFESGAGAEQRAEFPCKIQPGEWTHIVLVYTASDQQARCYLNGQEIEVARQTMALGSPNDAAWVIGGTHPKDWREIYNGLIDDVAVWSSALTPEQISVLHAAADDPALGYNAGEVQALFELSAGTATNENVVIDGKMWTRTDAIGERTGGVVKDEKSIGIVLSGEGGGVLGKTLAETERVKAE